MDSFTTVDRRGPRCLLASAPFGLLPWVSRGQKKCISFSSPILPVYVLILHSRAAAMNGVDLLFPGCFIFKTPPQHTVIVYLPVGDTDR